MKGLLGFIWDFRPWLIGSEFCRACKISISDICTSFQGAARESCSAARQGQSFWERCEAYEFGDFDEGCCCRTLQQQPEGWSTTVLHPESPETRRLQLLGCAVPNFHHAFFPLSSAFDGWRACQVHPSGLTVT